MFSGGYFYSYHMMHLACAALFTKGVDEDATLTNDHRPGFISTLYPIGIASSDQVQRQQQRDEPVRENTHLVLDTLASRLRSYHSIVRS